MKVGTRYYVVNDAEKSLYWSMLCVAEVEYEGERFFLCTKDGMSPREDDFIHSCLAVFDKDGIEVSRLMVDSPFRIAYALKPRSKKSESIRLVPTGD